MDSIHYSVLHNRKTGGTALKHAIDQQKQRTPAMNVTLFGHAMSLPKLVKDHMDTKAIFFIRHPILRFVSGFYSRMRQGMPRYHFPWSSKEAKAFARFQTPNQLAEALSATHRNERKAAIDAMQSIRHVKHTYVDFLGSISFLNDHVSTIAYIGYQPEFDADFVRLRLLLGIDANIHTPQDDIGAHRSPNDVDKYLSAKAIENLESWYQKDMEIYQWCLELRQLKLSSFDLP
jgi:hypothetical protein